VIKLVEGSTLADLATDPELFTLAAAPVVKE
jgi:hypothetical protein